jgi:hypothetical protein
MGGAFGVLLLSIGVLVARNEPAVARGLSVATTVGTLAVAGLGMYAGKAGGEHERAAEPQDCVGLERAAVWEQESIEERLLDALLGRPNADEERLKVRLR